MFGKEDRKRSSLKIIAEILQIARKGVMKTHIVYGANLNFKMLEEYLADLKRKGFVTYSEDTNMIKTTKRGKKYLRQFHQLEVLTRSHKQHTNHHK